MIKKLLLGIILGLCAIIALAPFDSWIKERAESIFLSVFRDNFNCMVEGKVTAISFFPAALTVSDLMLTSTDHEHGKWQWRAHQYTTGFSWPALLFSHIIDMWVAIDGLDATTTMCDGKIAIIPHLQQLMKGPVLSFPLTLKSVEIQKAVSRVDSDYPNECRWDASFKRIDDRIRGRLSVTNGFIGSGDQKKSNHSIENIAATITLMMPTKGSFNNAHVVFDGSLNLPDLGQYPTRFLTGHLRDGRARLQLQSIDQQLRIMPLIIYPHEDTYYYEVTAAIPFSYLHNLIAPDYPIVSGTCIAHARGAADRDGDTTVNFMSDNTVFPLIGGNHKIKGTVTKKGRLFEGTAETRSEAMAWKTTFSWDDSYDASHGRCHIENSSRLHHRSLLWQIPPKSCTAEIIYNGATHSLHSNYDAALEHTLKDQKATLTGSWQWNADNHLHLQSRCNDYFLDLDASTSSLIRCDLHDQQKRSMLSCSHRSDNRYTGSIDLTWLRNLMQMLCGIDLQAEGAINYTASVHDAIVACSANLDKATVRLAQTFNFIERGSVDLTYDSKNNHIAIDNLIGGLYAGTATMKHGTVWLDQEGQWQFVYLPIILDHCLISATPDLFSIVSGALLIEKRPTSAITMRGNLLLERSHLKENIFSADMQKRFEPSLTAHYLPEIPIVLDLTVETKEPIRIETPFLQADAQAALHVRDTITNPNIEGLCTLSDGTIQFPYKSLFITKGEVRFLKDQPFNPLITLMAKNKIKNHHVMLHVNGSLQDHMVILDANPPLTEGQIVNLLVAGAHEESLQALLPTLLMQNITNYIFNAHQSNFFERHIKPWMKHINVQLIPNFTQQSGRGGLRGALEVTINDRWRALIEKNFSLSEDTRFELEYLLSDDITFRLLRDERCDIGAEVEMKWKF